MHQKQKAKKLKPKVPSKIPFMKYSELLTAVYLISLEGKAI
jgi:hypothetical protein